MTSDSRNLNKAETWRRRAWLVALVAGAGCALGALVDMQHFQRGYLLGFTCWCLLSVGCLGLMLMDHLFSADWAVLARPILEAGVWTLPLMAALFVPLVFGLTDVYPWTSEHFREQHAEHSAKAQYLQSGFFLGRAAVYFALWIGLAFAVRGWSQTIPAGELGGPSPLGLRRLGAGGLVLVVFTVSLAGIDWVMSLEPDWHSTIFGMLLGASGLVGAMASVIVVATLCRDDGPASETETRRIADLGNLLLALLMVWAYLGFSQYLIIWSGNIPEEVTWYVARTTGGWQWLAISIVLLHFFAPFALLFSRERKREPDRLAKVALLVIAMHSVHMYWTIAPAFRPDRLSVHWLDLAALLAIGGLWAGVFLTAVARQRRRGDGQLHPSTANVAG